MVSSKKIIRHDKFMMSLETIIRHDKSLSLLYYPYYIFFMKKILLISTIAIIAILLFPFTNKNIFASNTNNQTYKNTITTFQNITQWIPNYLENKNFTAESPLLKGEEGDKTIFSFQKNEKNNTTKQKNVASFPYKGKEFKIEVLVKPEILKKIEIAFLWDIMLGSRVGKAIDEKWLAFAFSGTQDFLSKKDMVVLNLENPVTDQTKIAVNKRFNFKANSKHLKWLKAFNKNLVAQLANNHIWDFWTQWILDTFKHLKDYEISYFWAWKDINEANSVKIFEIKWLKIWLMWQSCIWPTSYKASNTKAGSSFVDKEVIKSEIKKAREEWVDLIIYNMHCWDEYKNWPNWTQKDYSHFAIDSWADLVIGHHPHWYQGVEKYKDKYIVYSLWDYIFDIDHSRRTKDWIIANIIIEDKKITKIEIIPTTTIWFWWTVLVTDEIYRDFILNEIYQISKPLWDIESIKKWYVE